jgi:hypothetical protein
VLAHVRLADSKGIPIKAIAKVDSRTSRSAEADLKPENKACKCLIPVDLALCVTTYLLAYKASKVLRNEDYGLARPVSLL